MKEDFWFYLLAGTILLFIGIQVVIQYIKYRSIHNLITLIINILGFVGVIFAYLTPGQWLRDMGVEIRILILVVFLIILFISLFYREINQFIKRRRIKRK